MVLVHKPVLEPQEVVLIVLVHLVIQVVQDRNLHHALLQIGRLAFDDLDCNDLLRHHVLALCDLAKRAVAQNVKHEIAALFLHAQNVIHIQNVVAVGIVVAIVVGALGGLCQDTARVFRGLVVELGVAYMIGRGQLFGERSQWTERAAFRESTPELWLLVHNRDQVRL